MRLSLCTGLILLTQIGYGAQNADLLKVRTVYVLPMSSGLDQYLANRLTKDGTFQVVTDAQQADALLSDSIGSSFERRYEDLYPPKEDEDKDATEEKDKADTKDKKDKDKDDPWGAGQQRVGGGFGRARGTVFLVDRHTRNVLWSVYEPVKGTRPQMVEHRARDIADRLKRDIKSQEKAVAKTEKPVSANPAPTAPAAAPATAPVDTKAAEPKPPKPAPAKPAAPAPQTPPAK